MEEGMKVYCITDGKIYSGTIKDIEYANMGYTFCVEQDEEGKGNKKMESSQIGKTVFENREDAEKALNNPGLC